MSELRSLLVCDKPFITCARSVEDVRAELLATRFGMKGALARRIAEHAFGEPREGGFE